MIFFNSKNTEASFLCSFSGRNDKLNVTLHGRVALSMAMVCRGECEAGNISALTVHKLNLQDENLSTSFM